ncbi:MAG TPA: hypothetical protein VF572_02825 [Candidatus Saccharimonadales bacterium]|jgi:hypothetical protein
MPEVKKRTSQKPRGAQGVSPKGARRRERTGNGNGYSQSGKRNSGRDYHGGLSITVQIPNIRKPQQHDIAYLRRLFVRRVVVLPLAVIATAVVFAFAVQSDETANDVPQAAASARTHAEFKLLTPKVEQASTVRYDAKRDLATYTTTFSSARLTISQQQLPATFNRDPTALQKTAENIRAKQRIDTKRGPLYVATNEDGKNQLGLFADKDVLLMVHSDKTLDEISWKSFIEVLEAK